MPTHREVIEQLTAERDEARRLAADYRWQGVEADGDAEEWRRWAYHGDTPAWLGPPEWFLKKHPWMAPEEGD